MFHSLDLGQVLYAKRLEIVYKKCEDFDALVKSYMDPLGLYLPILSHLSEEPQDLFTRSHWTKDGIYLGDWDMRIYLENFKAGGYKAHFLFSDGDDFDFEKDPVWEIAFTKIPGYEADTGGIVSDQAYVNLTSSVKMDVPPYILRHFLAVTVRGFTDPYIEIRWSDKLD